MRQAHRILIFFSLVVHSYYIVLPSPVLCNPELNLSCQGMDDLVREELAIPTTASNVQQRYDGLSQRAAELVQAGNIRCAESVLPGTTARRIADMLAAEKFDGAAEVVRLQICEYTRQVPREGQLESLLLATPPRPSISFGAVTGDSTPAVQAGRVQGHTPDDPSLCLNNIPQDDRRGCLQMILEDLVRQEAQQSTSAANVSLRYRLLSEVMRGLLQSGNISLLDTVMPNERRLQIEALLRREATNAAAQLVRQSVEVLRNAARENPSLIDASERGACSGPPGSVQLASPSSAQSEEMGRAFAPSPAVQGVLPRCEGAAFGQRAIPIHRWAIHTLATDLPFPPVVKLGMPAIDPVRRKLYVTGTRSNHLAIIDLDKDIVERTVDIGVTGGYLLLDQTNGDLYLFQIGRQFFKLDAVKGIATPITQLPPTVRMPPQGEKIRYKNRLFFDTGFPFQRGYLQTEKASYGKIHVLDATTEREVAQIIHGPDALYFVIDQTTGKLYASNTGDCSITVYDCDDNYRLLKYIDVGTTLEGITINPSDGLVFLRNRMGGSEIYAVNPDTGVFTALQNDDRIKKGGIGLWPMSMEIYDNMLYSLSHFEGKIDVIDIMSKKVSYSIELSLPDKPRTEGLSSLVINRREGKIFVSLPELGLIAVVDIGTRRQIGTITIPDMAEAHCKGPNCMMLATSDATNRLMVYLPWKHDLQVYSVTDYSLLKSLDVATTDEWLTTIRLDDAWGVFAVGNTILSLDTLATVDTLDENEYVVAMDTKNQRIYARRGCRDAHEQYHDTLLEYVNGEVTRSWSLEPVPGIPCSFAFDFLRKRFYVGYFETAILEEYSL